MEYNTPSPPPTPPKTISGILRQSLLRGTALLCAAALGAVLGFRIGFSAGQRVAQPPDGAQSPAVQIPGTSTDIAGEDPSWSARCSLVLAELFVQNQRFEAAIDLLARQQLRQPEEASLQQRHQELVKEQATTRAAQLAADGDPLGAAQVLRDASAQIGGDQQLLSDAAQQESVYADGIVQQVLDLIREKAYDRAQSLLDDALTKLPDHDALLQSRDHLDSVRPIYLLDRFTPYSTERYKAYVNGQHFESATVSFTNGFALEHHGSAAFNLNGEYDTLQFSVGHVDGASEVSVVIEIYGDGTLLKEFVMNPLDIPVEVKGLSVTGVKQLLFFVDQTDNVPYPRDTFYGFGEIILEKTAAG